MNEIPPLRQYSTQALAEHRRRGSILHRPWQNTAAEAVFDTGLGRTPPQRQYFVRAFVTGREHRFINEE